MRHYERLNVKAASLSTMSGIKSTCMLDDSMKKLNRNNIIQTLLFRLISGSDQKLVYVYQSSRFSINAHQVLSGGYFLRCCRVQCHSKELQWLTQWSFVLLGHSALFTEFNLPSYSEMLDLLKLLTGFYLHCFLYQLGTKYING